MTLASLFSAAGVTPSARRGDAGISRAVIDSRACVPGSLFVCMPGGSVDPHGFIPSAMANGAVAAIVFDSAVFEAHSELPMALLDAGEYEDALWRLMDALYDHPSRNMTLVGVTGTNGKTTTAWLVRQLFTLLGRKAGYLGTLGFSLDGRETRELSNTTPFCVEAYDLIAEARDAGIEALAMEVSSHALAQKRVDGLEFDVAVFTNLTQDHLDFHGSMEAYRDAKLRLFSELLSEDGTAVFHMADPAAKEFIGASRGRIAGYDSVEWSFWSEAVAHVTRFHDDRSADRFSWQFGWPGPDPDLIVLALDAKVGVDRIEFAVSVSTTEKINRTITSVVARLGGAFNVENLLAALTAVLAVEGSDKIFRHGYGLLPVPGRFEPVPNERGIGVLVDYAHTPDALEKVLDTAKALTKGRLLAVFGCGGDRDRSKRPKMARAASERADLTVVTSDNPRTENAQTILEEVLTGIVPGKQSVAIIDRREAVAHAIKAARPGDTVVIAGKGHENYQILGRTKHPMDDRDLAREALEALGPL